MKILTINSVNYGSTGKNTLIVADLLREQGHSVYTSCANGRSMRAHKPNCDYYIGTRLEKNLHLLLGKLTGFNGCFSIFSTWRFLRWADRFQPDAIYLNNLHNAYINLGMLFKYIKKNNISVVWTLHDCWSFTGHCPHFTLAKCDKWKTGCHSCPQYRSYPATYFDRSKAMWKLKRKWFTGIQNMTIVTPSYWLGNLVKQSYLKDYDVKVIHNGIDLDIFQAAESNFRRKHNCENKYILLGVSFYWGHRKGLDVFVELAKRLDKRYQIVLVGTNDEVDKQLPENIISIHRTMNQAELAEIYTAADLFVNPTREEVLGMVNIEALACGTPVVTFRTGGSAEIPDESCGCIVNCDDVDAMEEQIRRICENKPYSSSACIKRAKCFNQRSVFNQYAELFKSKYD